MLRGWLRNGQGVVDAGQHRVGRLELTRITFVVVFETGSLFDQFDQTVGRQRCGSVRCDIVRRMLATTSGSHNERVHWLRHNVFAQSFVALQQNT